MNVTSITRHPRFGYPKIKVVTLDNFYESMNEPNAKKTFFDMMHIRAQGFGPEYSKSYLPLDRVDFFCRHQVLYIQMKEDTEWEPFGCYKQVLFSECEFYSTELPLVAFIKSAKGVRHLESLEQIIRDSKTVNRPLLYGGGLAMKKEVRQNPTVRQQIHELLQGLIYLDTLDFNQPYCFTAAAVRFKVNQFYDPVGYKPLKYLGAALEPLVVASAANELAVIMMAEAMTDFAKTCYENQSKIIQNREIISAVTAVKKRAA